MDYRKEICEMIESRIKNDIEEVDVSKDIEVGIYNWTINFCQDKKISKNWKNNKFVNIYILKAKSVIANIDKKSYVENNRLLDRLKGKEFNPVDIAFMQRDYLFPEIWKDTIDDYIKKKENAYVETQVAMSDQIKCKKCHKREVTYIEKQCRSADEPMSLLCTCIVCGNRWRIG
jgi:DNA-directed RNA polymerase subunit M/transcription elongation factor TFIIS